MWSLNNLKYPKVVASKLPGGLQVESKARRVNVVMDGPEKSGGCNMGMNLDGKSSC